MTRQTSIFIFWSICLFLPEILSSNQLSQNATSMTKRKISLSPTFLNICSEQTHLSLRSEYGVINVTCSRSPLGVDALLFELVHRNLITPSEFGIVRNQTISILNRYLVVPACVLTCHRGTLFRRASFFVSSGTSESLAVSLGCHDFNDLRCTDSSPSNRNAQNCDIDTRQKVACGNSGITREQCLHHNCCWNATNDVRYQCYQSLNIQSKSSSHLIWRQHGFRSNQILQLLRKYQRPTRPSPSCGCNNPQRGLLNGPRCTSSGMPTSFSARLVHSRITPKSLDLSANARNDARLPQIRVFGGTSVRPENWPWQAIVYFDDKLCGGTLISDDLVLTAAHCVTNSHDRSVTQEGTVTLGARNISVFESTNPVLDGKIQRRVSRKVIRHENFTVLSTGVMINDIALIKLERKVSITGPYVRPLCLPTSSTPESDSCYVTGFGLTSSFQRRTPLLQAACVPTVSISTCQRYFGGNLSSSSHVCAGSAAPNSPDTCRGDSGGPLVCKKSGTSSQPSCGWYLAGISSFGNAPCGNSSPSVYTNVYNYLKWITAKTKLMKG